MGKKKVMTLGEARRLSDQELVETFFDDPSSRAVTHRVILERMKRDGYTGFFDWVWDTWEELKTKPLSEKEVVVDADVLDDSIIPMSRDGETLRRELTAIINSSYSFTGVHHPRRCREFCSERGNVLDLKEKQLTPAQKRMLGLIRDRADRFLRGDRR